MAVDMLVKLYDLDEYEHIKHLETLKKEGITFKRALPIDKHLILKYVRSHFTDTWVNECEVALTTSPVTCFIAVKNQEIIGFACYESTAKGYFGPLGVSKELRGKGIGVLLTKKCLLAMKEAGFGYAIIGWVTDAVPFYQKCVGATIIENSFPGVYSRMIDK
ncbi:GNAT family N-acetyltransferase [Halalkalibacter kiskunsagensis]|uniref:GNAT family N-acetyltransferase n=1 Tax=Halalkalibacter kiskunsagensis TaxID=1548599 RepID=A0ABV6KFL7_9BACI